MFRHHLNKETGILEFFTQNQATLEGMLEVLEFLKTDRDLPRNLRILEDGREAIASFPIHEFASISEKLKEVLVEYNSIKHAVIHKTPVNTVYAMIFGQKHAPPNYRIEVFSTREAALAWLLT